MDPAIIVAVIALLGSLVSAALSFYWQSRTAERTHQREASAILAKYREPLAYAAYELQSRLFNIVRGKFLEIYYRPLSEADWRRQYAVSNTLYVIGQYFAWTEIVRKQVQFFSFPDVPQMARYAQRQKNIFALFDSDEPRLGRALMMWRGEQRAIGELMTTAGEDGTLECMGYAEFVRRLDTDPRFGGWFQRLSTDIDTIAHEPNQRLAEIQGALVDLILELDPQAVRFPGEELGKLLPNQDQAGRVSSMTRR